eukprot:1138647-Pelagomonas_calceolata.AAC.5
MTLCAQIRGWERVSHFPQFVKPSCTTDLQKEVEVGLPQIEQAQTYLGCSGLCLRATPSAMRRAHVHVRKVLSYRFQHGHGRAQHLEAQHSKPPGHPRLWGIRALLFTLP